jgi:hypothetical protein
MKKIITLEQTRTKVKCVNPKQVSHTPSLLYGFFNAELQIQLCFKLHKIRRLVLRLNIPFSGGLFHCLFLYN